MSYDRFVALKKNLLIVLLSSLFCAAFAQSEKHLTTCMSTLTAGTNKTKGNSNNVLNLVSTLVHDTCVGKQFSLMFYIVDDPQATGGGITQANINDAVTLLNDAFKRICVKFVTCSLKVIPNHTFNTWRAVFTESMVINNFYTENTINIYLAQTVMYDMPGSELPSYTYKPGSNPKNIIVLGKNVLTSTQMALRTNILHEMGHFFGLPNTYDEIGTPVTPGPVPPIASYEFVDGSNCNVNGDGFCDTEADNFVPSPPPPSPADGKGEFYVVPLDNYMSSYGTRCRYSQLQYNYMARIIVSKMLFLH